MRMGVIEWLNRPEYVYQPGKLIRRVFGRGSGRQAMQTVELRWKLPIEIDASEVIGRLISHHGIVEIPVVEALFRLIDPGEAVFDVGANIGYMTAVALAAGAGKVISFEPHPFIFARLARNAERWNREPGFAGRVDIRNLAVSSEKGHAVLCVPESFAGNNGMASLEGKARWRTFKEVEVATATLDSVIAETTRPVGVMKVDIEGHEYQAFKGACDSLQKRMIRDIIYECFEGADGEASKLLASYGYTIFGLRSSLAGPALLEHLEAGKRSYGDHNLVATLDPVRLRNRMSHKGFRCLSRAAKAGAYAEAWAKH
jgi:FkbM family methyltransferase